MQYKEKGIFESRHYFEMPEEKMQSVLQALDIAIYNLQISQDELHTKKSRWIAKLIQLHGEKREADFKETVQEIAREYRKAGNEDFALYLEAQIGETLVFIPM